MTDKYIPKASAQGVIVLGAITLASVSLVAVAGPGGLLLGLAIALHYWTFPRSSATWQKRGVSTVSGDLQERRPLVSLSGGAAAPLTVDSRSDAVAIPREAGRQRRESARVLAGHGPAVVRERAGRTHGGRSQRRQRRGFVRL